MQLEEYALIRVKVQDPEDVVDRVVARVGDYPEQPLPLNDDGERFDETAGDGVWTRAVRVPVASPPGEFVLEITAYDENDNVVLVKTAEGSTAELQTTVPFVVRYPDDGEPAEPAAAGGDEAAAEE